MWPRPTAAHVGASAQWRNAEMHARVHGSARGDQGGVGAAEGAQELKVRLVQHLHTDGDAHQLARALPAKEAAQLVLHAARR